MPTNVRACDEIKESNVNEGGFIAFKGTRAYSRKGTSRPTSNIQSQTNGP